MGLRDLAESDLQYLIEQDGDDITLTSPEGVRLDLVALTNDISQVIDPDTGMLVSGRSASIAVRMSSLLDIGIPYGVPDGTKKPWTVTFGDVLGNPWEFKITYSNPDRTVGVVTCRLEKYDR